MAQTRRDRADPVAVYRLHAEEARAAMASAPTDEARTHLDHAASHHETAARILARVPLLQRDAEVMRRTALNARGGRRPRADVAEFYEKEAAKRDAAAAASPIHAERHHARGLERTKLAGTHDSTLDEDGLTAAQRDAVDAAAALVVAGPDDSEFMTAARRAQIGVGTAPSNGKRAAAQKE